MTTARPIAITAALSLLTLMSSVLIPTAAAAAASNPTVGDTIQLTGIDGNEHLAVTLTKINDPARPANDISDPSGGDRLVGVQVRITNQGTAMYSDAPDNDVTLVDANGQSYNTTFDDVSAGPSFPGSVNIPDGDSRLGYVVFEIPSSATVTEVQFTPDSGLSDDVGTWSVPPRTPTAPRGPATSSPGTVVTEFYDAINAGDYQKAWDLGGKNLGHGYDTFAGGFANTQHDAITIGSTHGDVVHVDLDAEMTDGSHQSWTGTYTVRGGVIVAGHLRRD